MAIIGAPKHFHTKFKFQIEIDDISSAAFASVSELKAEIAKIEYYEGGVIRPYKEPGRLNFSDITIERAVTANGQLYHWFTDTATASTNSGLVSDKFKRGGFIIQYDRDNEILRRWQLYGLWPTSFTGGSWDNNSDEFCIEQVVLAVDYYVLREDNEPLARSTRQILRDVGNRL